MSNVVSASIDVAPSRPQIEYSRHIFGQFIEDFHRQVYGGIFEPGSPLADERGFRVDVLDALREMRVPNVRWPGGCFVSAYHWVDGIGSERVPVYDRAWRVTDPNTFGTDEFLQWCEELGAAPYICTNAGTGTPEEMADWLAYTNRPVGSKWSDMRSANGHPDSWNVPFWSIGNENYGDWELGAKNGAAWAEFVTESAKLMLREDDSIALLAAAVEKADWALPLLEKAGRYLKYISIHGYWDKINQKNTPAGYLECMAKTLEPERQIALVRSMIEVSGQQHVQIAFDEWNLRGWHHPVGNSPEAIAARDLNDDNSTYTMADAVFSACFLNSCIRNGDKVGMANFAPTVNTRGPLFVHPEGVVKRTTFHVMSMYANLLGPRNVDAAVSSDSLSTGHGDVPIVDALVTADGAGYKIALINKSDTDTVRVSVRIDGAAINGLHDATILAGSAADAYNDIDAPDAVAPVHTQLAFESGVVEIPAHSVTICSVAADSAPTVGQFPWTIGTPAAQC